MRQHVLWFDEYYDSHQDYQWSRVLEASASCDAALFVGTSFSVGVTDLILRSAVSREVPVLSVDPAPVPALAPATLVSLQTRAEDLLPAVARAMAAG